MTGKTIYYPLSPWNATKLWIAVVFKWFRCCLCARLQQFFFPSQRWRLIFIINEPAANRQHTASMYNDQMIFDCFSVVFSTIPFSFLHCSIAFTVLVRKDSFFFLSFPCNFIFIASDTNHDATTYYCYYCMMLVQIIIRCESFEAIFGNGKKYKF